MSEADSALLTSSATPIAFPFSAFMRSSVAEQSFMSAATTSAPAAARLRAKFLPDPACGARDGDNLVANG
jgi:hypothetical protein